MVPEKVKIPGGGDGGSAGGGDGWSVQSEQSVPVSHGTFQVPYFVKLKYFE